MVFEKVMPASRLPEMGRGAACRAYDLAQSLNVIHRHYRRIQGQDHCVFDEDRLMAHILDCVGTLRRMQALFDPYNTDNQDLQAAREETFQKALYLMLHHSTETGGGAISSLCESFPGFGDTSASSQSTTKRSWQPTHWAVIAIDKPPHQQHQSNSAIQSPIKSEQDDHYVRTVQLFVGHDEKSLALSQFGVNPTLPNQLYIPHWQEQHTPADLLCMQAKANLDVIKHLDHVVPGIFTQGCSLELAARHSTSRTLVEFLLQQQPLGESKSTFKGELHRYPGYPLTLLLKRAAGNSQMYRQIQSQCEGQGQGAVDDEDNRLFDDLFDLLIKANHTPEVVGDALHCLLSSSCTSLGGVKRLELCKKMIALQPQAIHAKCGSVRDCFPLQTFVEGLAHTPSPVCTSVSVSIEKEVDKDDDLNARKALFNYLLTIHPDAVKAMDAEGLVPVFRAVGGFHTPPDIVKTLVTKYPEGLRLHDRDGLSPVHVASVQGTKAHLEILLQAYPASIAEKTDPRAGLGGGDENVLQYACRSQNDPYHLSSYFRQKQQQRTAQNHNKLIPPVSSIPSLPSPEEGDVLAMTSGRARQIFRPIDIDKVLTLLSFLKNKTALHGVPCWRQELLHARDSNGWMLLHHLACYCTSMEVFQAMYEAEPDCFHEVAIKVIETETGELMFLDPTDEADVVHMQSDDTGWDASFCPYLRTPLHMFLAMNTLNDPLDPIADTFRYLVSISDPQKVLSVRDSYGHTPYDHLRHNWGMPLNNHGTEIGGVETNTGEAVMDTMATLTANDHQHTLSTVDPLESKAYFQRIVLNACPTVNILAYRNLNYEARRSGMYLGYIIPITALRKEEKKHFLWRQLRLVEASLLQSIIMFL